MSDAKYRSNDAIRREALSRRREQLRPAVERTIAGLHEAIAGLNDFRDIRQTKTGDKIDDHVLQTIRGMEQTIANLERLIEKQ